MIDRLRPSRRALAPRTWRLVGLAAGVVLSLASWFSGATPREYPTVWPGLAPWSPGGGSPLAATGAYLALGAMLYAWWALRDAAVTARWHVHTAALWFAPLLLGAPLFSRDVYSYAAQGLMLHVGLDPYSQGVQDLQSGWVASVSPVWLDTPAPYGPLFLVLARSAAAVSGGNLLVALALLRLLSVAGVVALMWAVPAVARRLGTDEVRAAWLGVLTPLVGTHLVSGAHNDSLMVAATVSGLALALRRHHVWACALVAAAMAVKAPAVVVMPFVAILWAADRAGPTPMTWPRVIGRSLLAGATTVAGFAVISLGSGLGFSWLSALGTPGRSVQWTSLPTALGTGVGAIGSLLGFQVQSAAVTVLRAAALAVTAAVLAAIWLHAVKHSHDRRLVTLSAGQALLAVVVLAPALHGWYLLWFLPILATCVTDRRWRTALAAGATVAALAVLPGGYSLALTTTWVGVPLAWLVTGILAVAVVRWTRRYPWREILSLAEADADRARGATMGAMREITQSRKLAEVCYDIRGPVLDEAKRLEEEGHRILRLNIGNPAPFGFEAPEEILVDVIASLPTAQGYSDSKGILSARRAVAQYFQVKDVEGVDIEDIYLGNGVSELIVMAMQALLDNGDEVLIPAPDYPLWTAATSLAGGRPVHYLCDEAAGWAPDLDDLAAKITPRTTAIVVINPNNPTGAVYSTEVLQSIADLARKHGLVLMADEIYDKILYDGNKHTALASLAPDVLCLTFNGLSKAYRVAGFRAGWLGLSGPKHRARSYIEGLNILANMRLCANVPAQHAIQTALGGHQSINDLVLPGGRLLEQRNRAWELVNEIPGVSCTKPGGSLYLFPRLDPAVYAIEDDELFALELLREQKILVVQGTGFNWPHPDHFRIVTLPRVEVLEEAIGRIGEFLGSYRQ